LRAPLSHGLSYTDALIIMGETSFSCPYIPSSIPRFYGALKASTPKGDPQKPMAAFAGIAYPEKFRHTLHKLHIYPDPFMVYADHHRFTGHDWAQFKKLLKTHTLLTTEKDWVRLPKELQQEILPVPVTLDLPEAFLGFVLEHIGKSNRFINEG
jgi:tetraacyldisaccharide-1-P 4'-kinase